MGKKKSVGELYRRIVNMADAIDDQVETFDGQQTTEHAVSLFRRVEELSRLRQNDTLVTYRGLPEPTKEVIEYLFETAQFEDYPPSPQLFARTRRGLLAFQTGVIAMHEEPQAMEAERVM